eukprot:CAMPEP_0196689368 /NCGR_PEP_ID=MMETSP1090-20130531/17992_1 /TAXON_ID=37098 /ORGANISM="Isochrysis sp, Strain CCMP1244" /LENGTH=62 /DNA_ID=CAMNT_0042028361 /DNA_START=170 /DNA_END=355 /DNA_ORIENTATION=-
MHREGAQRPAAGSLGERGGHAASAEAVERAAVDVVVVLLLHARVAPARRAAGPRAKERPAAR